MPSTPTIHASAFAYHGMGCLIMGESGMGKSRLLADALLHGAHLIADDRVRLDVASGHLVARPVPNLLGVMELRGLGLITLPDAIQSHPIHLVIELNAAASERLPEPQTTEFLGITVPYLRLLPPPAMTVASLLLYLKAMQEQRILPTDWRPGE